MGISRFCAPRLSTPRLGISRTTSPLAALALGVGLLAPVPALAGLAVRFLDTPSYGDEAARDPQTLAELRRHMERLDARYVGAGRALSIDILDIRLAGEYEPWRANLQDVRILRGTTPPRIRLRYVLSENGRRLSSGEVVLTDMNYMMNPPARTATGRFPFEKALFTDWFRSTFAATPTR